MTEPLRCAECGALSTQKHGWKRKRPAFAIYRFLMAAYRYVRLRSNESVLEYVGEATNARLLCGFCKPPKRSR
jgi:hypothetical protein